MLSLDADFLSFGVIEAIFSLLEAAVRAGFSNLTFVLTTNILSVENRIPLMLRELDEGVQSRIVLLLLHCIGCSVQQHSLFSSFLKIHPSYLR